MNRRKSVIGLNILLQKHSDTLKRNGLIYILLTAIGLMPGGSVYKDHTFNNETAYLRKTAQYIARIFTVQVFDRLQYNTST
jgi:hypothetical protein